MDNLYFWLLSIGFVFLLGMARLFSNSQNKKAVDIKREDTATEASRRVIAQYDTLLVRVASLEKEREGDQKTIVELTGKIEQLQGKVTQLENKDKISEERIATLEKAESDYKAQLITAGQALERKIKELEETVRERDGWRAKFEGATEIVRIYGESARHGRKVNHEQENLHLISNVNASSVVFPGASVGTGTDPGSDPGDGKPTGDGSS